MSEGEILVAEVNSDASFGMAVSKLTNCVKNLAQSETALARAEVKATLRRIRREFLREVVFGVLLAFSILSFLSFLIFGLGKLLGNNFWLSSLILSLVLGLIGCGIVFRRGEKSHDRP